MNLKERDALLIRLDERTDTLVYIIKEQEKHLRQINGQVSANKAQGAVNQSSIYRMWWFVGGSFTLICSGIAIALKVGGVY